MFLLDILDLEQTITPLKWAVLWLLVFISLSLNYFSISGVSYWYYWIRSGHTVIKIQDKAIASNQIQHEITWSIVSIGIFSTMTIGLIAAWRLGLFPNLYFQPLQYGWLVLIGNFLLFVFIQDLLFYLSHRMLHSRKLLRFHRTHHVSLIPTPFALYSFHPVEAMIHFIRLPMVLWICPVNAFALIFAEGVLSNVLNAYSHLNHEPLWIRKIRPVHELIAAASSFHSLHHLRGHGNYGGYLRLWDRLWKTQLAETKGTDAKAHGR